MPAGANQKIISASPSEALWKPCLVPRGTLTNVPALAMTSRSSSRNAIIPRRT